MKYYDVRGSLSEGVFLHFISSCGMKDPVISHTNVKLKCFYLPFTEVPGNSLTYQIICFTKVDLTQLTTHDINSYGTSYFSPDRQKPNR